MKEQALPAIVHSNLEWLQVVDVNKDVKLATNNWAKAYECWVSLVREIGWEPNFYIKTVLLDYFALCSKSDSEPLFASNNYQSVAKRAYEQNYSNFSNRTSYCNSDKQKFSQALLPTFSNNSITSEVRQPTPKPADSIVELNRSDYTRRLDFIVDEFVKIAEQKKFLTLAEMVKVPEVLEMPVDEFEWLYQRLLDLGVRCFDSDEAAQQWLNAQTNKSSSLKKTGKSFKSLYEKVSEISPDQSLLMKVLKGFPRLPRSGVRFFMKNLLTEGGQNQSVAFEKLFLHYSAPTVRAAFRYYQKNQFSVIELGDLIQEGLEVLNNVLTDYAITGSNKFQTSLMLRLFNTFTRLHLTDLPVRIPVHQYEKIKSIMNNKKNRLVRNDNVVEDLFGGYTDEFDLLANDLKTALAILQGTKCIDELIENENESFIEHDFGYIHLQISITDVLLSLSSKEQKILRMRYGLFSEIPGNGLNHYSPITLEAVGKKLGVTRERIRQIESKAIKKLRHRSRSSNLKQYWIER